MKFVTDECVFKATVELLRSLGFDCLDLRERGLSGTKDYEVIGLKRNEVLNIIEFQRPC